MVLALLTLAGSISFARPQTTWAANPSDPDGDPYVTNLAGRPINGYSYNDDVPPTAPRSVKDLTTNTYPYGKGTGHAIAYAKVNGQLVLLYPYHARIAPGYDNTFVYGPNDSKIGYFGGLFTSEGDRTVCDSTFPDGSTDCVMDHDLAYIVLYEGNWPSDLNHIYRGSATGDNYWTITDPLSTGLTCASSYTTSKTIYHNFEKDISTFWVYRTGATYGVQSFSEGNAGTTHRACTVDSNLLWHNYPNGSLNPDGSCNACPIRDSGSPWVAAYNTATLFAITSSSWGQPYDSTVSLRITPLYEGMVTLDNYWESHGNNLGASLCRDADC